MSMAVVAPGARARLDATKKTLVYDILKDRIVRNALPPQQYLNETEICAELVVSKTPVREALQHLERDKLVVIIPNKGCFVAGIGLDLIREVFEVREVFECAAARFAAGLPSRERFAGLLSSHESFRASDDAGVRDSLISGYQIHQVIVEASGNSFISGFYQAVLAHILRIRVHFLARFESKRLHETVDEHRALLEAIIDGDADAAERSMREHLERSLVSISRLMLGNRKES